MSIIDIIVWKMCIMIALNTNNFFVKEEIKQAWGIFDG